MVCSLDGILVTNPQDADAPMPQPMSRDPTTGFWITAANAPIQRASFSGPQGMDSNLQRGPVSSDHAAAQA